MADINDHMDLNTETISRHLKSFMSSDWQAGAEYFLTGGAFNQHKSEDWKDGWNFAMKWAFMRNTFSRVFADR